MTAATFDGLLVLVQYNMQDYRVYCDSRRSNSTKHRLLLTLSWADEHESKYVWYIFLL